MSASHISFAGARRGCTGCGLPANAHLNDVAELNETGVSALDCERCGTADPTVDAVYFPAHRLDGTHADICWMCVQTVLAMPTPRYVVRACDNYGSIEGLERDRTWDVICKARGEEHIMGTFLTRREAYAQRRSLESEAVEL